jgi:biopolymer transport protein ExbD
MRKRSHRGYRQLIESDLEIMPLMNLFVALIPMLLISAVFLKVSAIDMQLPSDDAEADVSSISADALNLSVRIRDDEYVVQGRRLSRRVVIRKSEDAETKLSSILEGIKHDHPENEELVIVSQPNTRYDDIVRVMDISRGSGMGAISLLGDSGY